MINFSDPDSYREECISESPCLRADWHRPNIIKALAGELKSIRVKYLFLLLAIFFTTIVCAQRQQISGTITDSLGAPVASASIIEKGTTNGTTSGDDGRFVLVVNPNARLIISSIGYATVEMPATDNMRIVLNASAIEVGRDVVVVAYGTQDRATMTSSQTSISSSEFRGQPVIRLDQALQGRAAGVQVTNTTGAPGGDVRIRIRGANSINGDNGPLYVIDGFVGGDFNVINPDDVVDIQILKDAAATAPYGSRGSNGVIIVTTKKGSRGRANLSLTSRLSYSEVTKTYDKLNAADFAEIVNERARVSGNNDVFTAQQISQFRNTGGTDWQKEIYRKAVGQQYELAVNGGGENTNYYISGSYHNLPGVIINSWYKFYNIRSNINATLSDKLSTYINFNGFARNNYNTFLRSGTQNAVVQALAWAPTTPVRDANGNYTRQDPVGSVGYNPLAEATDREALANNYSANISGGIIYKILPDLTLNVQYGVNYLGGQYKNYGSEYVSNEPYTGRSMGSAFNLQNINTLNYKKIFNGVHGLDLTAVVELQKDKSEGFNVEANNLIYPDFKWNNFSLVTLVGAGAYAGEASLFSVFGRANYAFDQKYLLSGTIRRDASSRFRGTNKYSYFPSVSLGWVLSRENFIQNMNIFDEFKLRGSWGLTGNQAISSYSTFATYSSTAMTYDNSSFVPGILIDRAENPDLKWETTEQINLGLDMRFLKNRMFVNIDYFNKNTRDLLFWVGLPAYVGGGGIMRNVGNVENKGWELTVGGTPVKTGNFTWVTDFNYSIVNNKIKKLSTPDNSDLTWDSDIGWGATNFPEFLLRVGEPMGAIYGVNYLGTWKPGQEAEAAAYGEKPGDSRYEDMNNDKKIDAADFTIIGYGLPKSTLGWNNTLNFKGFEMNVLLQGVFGFDKMNLLNAMSMAHFGDFRQPVLNDIKNRYIPGVNETSDIPAFSSTNKNFVQSSRFVSPGDFLRIKNVSLSYTVPKASFWNVASIRLFASVTNVFTFTKYNGMDPETANTGAGNDAAQSFDYGSYPIPRVFTGGITLNF